MPTYVKRAGSDVWHWCKNCTNYPSPSEIDETKVLSGKTRPSTGELDNQCKAKEDNDDCRLT